MTATGPVEIRRAIINGAELALVDVREVRHYREGHIVPAVSVPLSRLELMLPNLVPGMRTKVIFYDDGEGLARRAISVAGTMGYASVFELEGGLTGWIEAGGKTQAGEKGMLTPADDIYYHPPASMEMKMQMKMDYMDWQSGLDQQLQNDGIINTGLFA
jgi:rhodanese-related sulfurtransferase